MSLESFKPMKLFASISLEAESMIKRLVAQESHERMGQASIGLSLVRENI